MFLNLGPGKHAEIRVCLHVAQICMLLFDKGTSGGSAPTFVLESRCPAAAIIFPGLTFGIKALKLLIVSLDVASAA